MPPYTNTGPVNTDVDFDTSRVKGKTAVVTGGTPRPSCVAIATDNVVQEQTVLVKHMSALSQSLGKMGLEHAI